MIKLIRHTVLILCALTVPVIATAGSADPFIDPEILQGPDRTTSFVSRDIYRHPSATLAFFDVQPDMTVVEIWPGRGWYTEILTPHLAQGKLFAAHFPADSSLKYFRDSRTFFEEKMKAYPDLYGAVKLAEFSPRGNKLTVPEGSVDRVLTFRNVHNWLSSKNEAEAFSLFYRTLKPGGLLGVVEHRAKPDTDWNIMKSTGYMTEAYVIELAQQAGFILDARSEINANTADTTDHPSGVWTLPPTLRLKDKDRAKYIAIGESDRMTLRFRKPLVATVQ
jgi:predicted methyltransferase